MLTEIGFGRGYTAEFVHKGVEFTREFSVTESPPHYRSAPKYRDERLGMTVREMTFEVRRHFRKGPGDAGVIVSRVEPGARASVAGIRLYEIITHINGRKIETVADFEKQVRKADEVKVSVERMARTRQARIKLSP